MDSCDFCLHAAFVVFIYDSLQQAAGLIMSLATFPLIVSVILVGGMLTFAGQQLASAFSSTFSFYHDFLLHLFILAVAALLIWYDWKTLGPTMALKHGVVASAIAWVFVVPLGTVTAAVFDFAALSLLYIVGLLVAIGLCCSGCPFGLLSVPVLLLTYLIGSMASLGFMHAFGTVMIYLITYGVVRQFMGLQHTENWPHVEVVDPRSMEYQSKSDFFMAACIPWAHKYNFGLSIGKIYKVNKPGSVEMKAGDDGTDSRVRSLFHGTQRDYAKAIICDHFQLPDHDGGMFGKGIYFADCPLKSFQYCFLSRQPTAIYSTTGIILMCTVDLGKERHAKQADKTLSGAPKKKWFSWFRKKEEGYDSIIGLTAEEGGALRVPEYVIYKPDRVRVDYLFEVKRQEKGTG